MKAIKLKSLKVKRKELKKAIELAVKRHKPRKSLRKEFRKIDWIIFEAEGGITKCLQSFEKNLMSAVNADNPLLKMIKNRRV